MYGRQPLQKARPDQYPPKYELSILFPRKENRHRPRRRRLQAPKGLCSRSSRTDAVTRRLASSISQSAAKLLMQRLDALGVFVVGRVQRIQPFFIDDVKERFADHGQLEAQAAYESARLVCHPCVARRCQIGQVGRFATERTGNVLARLVDYSGVRMLDRAKRRRCGA